jgi:hypothetical protein
MRTPWAEYRLVIENVQPEDGGGYRIFYPTLGYAVYGVGDSIEESLRSLGESKRAFEEFLAANPAFELPRPALEDIRCQLIREDHSNNNFAYAA